MKTMQADSEQLLSPAQKFAWKFGSENIAVSSNHYTIAKQIDQGSGTNCRVSSKTCPHILHLGQRTADDNSVKAISLLNE